MTKALFLDRDGVINREIGDYVYHPDEFILLEPTITLAKKAVELGYLIVVVTNQAGISRGRYGHEEVEVLHSILRARYAAEGIVISNIYYCPHHPEQGKCLCRKPDSLMFLKALGRFQIDPAASFMLGDSERDIAAAAEVGIPGLLINSNESVLDRTAEMDWWQES